MRNLLLTIIAVVVAIFATGCGNKVATVKPELIQYPDETEKVYTTMIDMRDGRSLSRAYEAGVGATVALERTARSTLAAGHKYFAIWAPYRISNSKGSTINTFKDFQTQCVSGIIESTVSAFDVFGIGENGCGIAYAGNQNIAFIEYRMFDTLQDDFLTWDAKQLISDIEDAGEANDAGWEVLQKEYKSWNNRGADDRFHGIYVQWMKTQRRRQ